MNELIEDIRSRGHWRILIRPSQFVEERVKGSDNLARILEKASVRFRGWDFPHIDRRSEILTRKDFIEQEIQWEYYREYWRFYSSGQFIYYGGLVMDWIDHASWGTLDDPTPGSILSVRDTVYRFTEVFEFAARLALSEAGDSQMHMEVSLRGLNNKKLWIDPKASIPHAIANMTSKQDEIHYASDISREKLSGQSKELALEPALQVFQSFGWDASLVLIRSYQQALPHLSQIP